jgi:hypothetical protein
VEIKDLAGISEPLKRLIEVISNGIGNVYRPTLIRRTADAKAYELEKIAGTLSKIAQDHHLPIVYKDGNIEIWQKPEDKTLVLSDTPILERAESRLEYQERKRQNNIENVTSVAATQLMDENSVPESSPEEDWVTRFFNHAQDISSQDMQELWGRILAGEIKKPGSYSMRTLDFVRNLSKAEALIFMEVAKLAYQIPGSNDWVVFIHDKEWLERNRQIHPTHQFLLSELGLLYPSDLSLTGFQNETDKEFPLVSDEHLITIKRGGMLSKFDMPVWKFTGTGKELLPLIPKPLDDEYTDYIGKYFLDRNGEYTVGKINERLPDGRISYTILRQKKPQPLETSETAS